MRVVAFEGEVFVCKFKDVFDFGVDFHGWQGSRVASELFFRLVEVVGVEMGVAEGVDEFSWLQAGDLGHHQGEQRIAGDIEGDAEEDVTAALVELAGKATAGNIELEEAVAGGQGHLLDFVHFPGADDDAAGIRVVLDEADGVLDLVDAGFADRPVPPLGTVDRAQFTGFIGPFVPDGDPVFLQVPYIGLAL